MTRPRLLVWRDLARGVTHRLLADVWPLHISDVLQRGRLVMASDSVVDMDTGRLLGRVPVAPEYRRMLQKKRGPLAARWATRAAPSRSPPHPLSSKTQVLPSGPKADAATSTAPTISRITTGVPLRSVVPSPS